jgi:hypothetical protein
LFAEEINELEVAVDKGDFYSPSADLSFLPPYVRGSPTFRMPDLSLRGRSMGLKSLGSFVSADSLWASDELLASSSSASAESLTSLHHLTDNDKTKGALQAALGILRWSCNAKATFFLRSHTPDVTRAAAKAHDARIDRASAPLLKTCQSTHIDIVTSLRQSHLSLALMGGLGLHLATTHAPSTFSSASLSVLPPTRRLFPSLSGLSIVNDSYPLVVAIRSSLALLTDLLATATIRYETFDTNFIDHNHFGDKTFQYHPPLSSSAAIPTPMWCDRPDSKLSSAVKHHLAAAVDHDDWFSFYNSIRHDSLRSTIFIDVCQPLAGDFINELPTSAARIQETELLRYSLQRRLRLRLSPPAPPHLIDPYGDLLVNMGHHTPRHTDAMEWLADMCTTTFGTENVLIDPREEGGDNIAKDWSPDHIPDATIFHKAPEFGHFCADAKIANSVKKAYSSPANLERSASIAFANTGEEYMEVVHGRPEVARPLGTTSRFNRRNNTGHLAAAKLPQKALYAASKRLGHTPIAWIFNVFAGFHPEGYAFMKKCAKIHSNKLPVAHAGISWTATSFSAFYGQRLSSAINMAVAVQIRAMIRDHRVEKKRKTAPAAPTNWRGRARH